MMMMVVVVMMMMIMRRRRRRRRRTGVRMVNKSRSCNRDHTKASKSGVLGIAVGQCRPRHGMDGCSPEIVCAAEETTPGQQILPLSWQTCRSVGLLLPVCGSRWPGTRMTRPILALGYSTPNRPQLLTSDSDHFGEIGLFSPQIHPNSTLLPLTPGGGGTLHPRGYTKKCRKKRGEGRASVIDPDSTLILPSQYCSAGEVKKVLQGGGGLPPKPAPPPRPGPGPGPGPPAPGA